MAAWPLLGLLQILLNNNDSSAGIAEQQLPVLPQRKNNKRKLLIELESSLNQTAGIVKEAKFKKWQQQPGNSKRNTAGTDTGTRDTTDWPVQRQLSVGTNVK